MYLRRLFTPPRGGGGIKSLLPHVPVYLCLLFTQVYSRGSGLNERVISHESDFNVGRNALDEVIISHEYCIYHKLGGYTPIIYECYS